MLTREQKAQQIEWIKEQFKTAKPVVFVGYRGLTITQLDTLRNKVRELGGLLKVVKTRLLKKALDDLKVSYGSITADAWDKPVAFVLGSSDPVAVAKILAESAKEHEIMELFGGYIDAEIVNTQTIQQLSTLPSREALLAQVVGSLAAPIRGLVWGLRWNQYSLVSILRQTLDVRG